MKSAKTRILSLVICLLLALSLLPSAAFAADVVAINYTNFPDPNFYDFAAYTADKNGDLLLTVAERNAVTEINVQGLYISNLKGVEFFPAVRSLNCSNNRLTSLNLSSNTALVRVNCSNNQLTSLNVTKCTQLQYLACENNRLTSLDVLNNPLLNELTCHYNNITSMTVKKNPRLSYAIRKGTLYVNDHISYWISQSTGGYSIVFNISYDPTNTVEVSRTTFPKIGTQPKDATVAENKQATFTVGATGNNLTYQWYVIKKTGEPVKLDGKTSAKLAFTATKAKNGWKYFCVVTNNGGVVYSQSATLTVISAPTITTQPASKTAKAGAKVTFTVKAKGGSLTYQWYYQKPGTSTWKAISTGKAATLSFTAKAAKNGWKYRCTVSNPAGKVNSKSVKLTVK